MRFFFAAAAVVALILLSTPSDAWSSYRESIPNGNNVRCNGQTIPGVGHNSNSGGGSRNSFGTAFADAGRRWTVALCQADSDGDGFTNGQELGDPNCVWTGGAAPSSSVATHPGLASCVPVTPATTGAPIAPTTQRPATQRPATQRPATQRPATQRPATQRPATQRPASQRPATQRPATQRPATQRPASQRPTTKRPASPQQPASQRPTTKRPASQRPTTKRPTTRRPTTRSQ